MPVIQDTVTDAQGNPIQGVIVIVQLISASYPLVSNQSSTILSTRKTKTDAQGYWSMSVIGNADIQPPDTFYRIIYRVKGTKLQKFTIKVNTVGGGYWVGDLSTSISASVASSPLNLTASSGTAGGSINLTWTTPIYAGTSPITGYAIERNLAGAGFTSLTTTGVVLNYIDTTVGENVSAVYRVKAINAVGSSPWSSTAQATGAIFTYPPSAPLSLVASTGTATGSCDLTWAASSSSGTTPITNYIVERDIGSGFSVVATLGVVLAYTDLSAGAGVSCTYRIRAVNSIGSSPYSNTSTAVGKTGGTAVTSLPNAWTIAPFTAYNREKILPIDSNYTIPTGALYVDASNGSDTNAGTIGAPLQTIAKAYSLASTGGTIVLRGGTGGANKSYREGGFVWTKRVTLQAYAHEDVRIKGSDIVTGWTAVGSNWKKTNWDLSKLNRTHAARASGGASAPYAFPDDVINPAYPLAGYPDGVWLDDEPLTLANSLPLTPGSKTFYVDVTSTSTAGELYISEDPTGKVVEATTRQFFLKYSAGTSNSRIKGVIIMHYGCTYNYPNLAAICYSSSTLTDVAQEDCVFAYNANQGVSQDYGSDHGNTNCLFIYNGCLSHHTQATTRHYMINCRSGRNNDKHFDITASTIASIAAPKHYGGGSGATGGSPGPHRYLNNIIHDNDSNGLWFDTNVYDIIVANSIFQRNHGYPMRFELCPRNIAINCLFEDNWRAPAAGDGALTDPDSGCVFWYNTSVGNGINTTYGKSNFYIYDDSHTTFVCKDIMLMGNVIVSTLNTTNCIETLDGSTTGLNTGSAMIAANNYNLFNQLAGGTMFKWERASQTSQSFTTLAAFQTATGRETQSISVSGTPLATMFTDPANKNFKLKSAYASLVTPPAFDAIALSRLGLTALAAPTTVGCSDSLGILLGYGALPPTVLS